MAAALVFGSSSTVENFLSLIPAATLKAHPEVKLAAIGPVTAETLQKHGLTCNIMPMDYTIPALVDALKTYFTRYPCPSKSPYWPLAAAPTPRP